MRKNVWIDPVVYCDNWSCQLPIIIPDMSETEHSRRALSKLAQLLYDDPTLLHSSKRQKARRIRRTLSFIVDDIISIGFIETLKRYKDIGHLILSNLVWDENDQPTFQLVEEYTGFPIYGTLVTLHKVISRDGLSPFAGDLAQWILSWCYHLSKLPLSRPDLEDSSVSDWISTQEKSVDILHEMSIIEALSKIMSWLFEFHEDEFFHGKHGPGSTSTGARTIADKNRDFRRTIQTDQVLDIFPTEDLYDQKPLTSQEYAEWQAVEKDVGSLRPITMMPAALQMAQQKIKETIYHQTDDDFSLYSDDMMIFDERSRRIIASIRGIDTNLSYNQNVSHFVKYSSQDSSRQLALKGSIDNTDETPVTIDLSKASDRLQLLLVIFLLKGDFLHWALCARSWGSHTPHGVVEHSMFDGMGSALTFPIQTMVFISISLLATMIAVYEHDMGTAPVSYNVLFEDYLNTCGVKKHFRRWAKNIRVYGDDIIVPKIAADKAVDLLDRLGLRVNYDKSFYKNEAVREACGIYALGGRDITPLRFRQPVVKNNGPYDFAALESAREYANSAYVYGYRTLRRGIIRDVKSAKLFLNKKEKTAGKRLRKVRILKKVVMTYETLFNAPSLFFEEYRGPDKQYVGFISDRPTSDFYHHEVYGENRRCYTTFAPRLLTKVDDKSELYHFTEQLRRWSFKSVFSMDHGKIPRNIRLERRNVLETFSGTAGDSSCKMAWGWAPR
jgi:hypothetical protein